MHVKVFEEILYAVCDLNFLNLFPDLADHVQNQYMDTLCNLMVQRLSSLGQENEKLQDDGKETSTDSQPGIANQTEEFDKTQMKDSAPHGQQERAEETNSLQPKGDAKDHSMEEKEGQELGTPSGELFISLKGSFNTVVLFFTEEFYIWVTIWSKKSSSEGAISFKLKRKIKQNQSFLR